MVKAYLADIHRLGGKEPRSWRDDPFPMQIAKLDDSARKASAKASRS